MRKKLIITIITCFIMAIGFNGCGILDELELQDIVEELEEVAEETEEETEEAEAVSEDDFEEEDDYSETNEASDDENTSEPAEPEIDLSSIPEGYSVGERFPDFEMTDRDGNTVKLSDYRGKPLYLNCFTTWCTYCFYEMPDVQKIADTYDCNVVLLDLGETVAETDSYAAENRISLPINHVPDWEVGGLQLMGVPVSIILDENGIVVDGCEGMAEYDWMSKTMEAALGQ